MSRLNFFQEAKPTKVVLADKAKTTRVVRQRGIIAIYVVKNGYGSFYAKFNNKKYLIENYKLVSGKVYSKPGMTAYEDWTMKDLDKDLEKVTFDNYAKLEKIWASLYDGQPITGRLQNGMFKLIGKTDKLFKDV